MSVARALADPRVRLGAGTAALLVTAMAARRNRVSPGEAAAFRAVNDLPGWLYPPAWVVMQLGTLGAAPAAAGAAWLAGDRQLAGLAWRAARAPGRCPRSSSAWCSGPGPRACFRVPAAAAAKPPGSGTCPGTPAWPSSWARPSSPGSGRVAGPLPWLPFPSWA